MKSLPNLIEKEDIPELLELAEKVEEETAKETIIKTIEQKMDEMFAKTFFLVSEKGKIKVSDMDEIMFRVKTIQMIFDGFASGLSKKEYKEIAKKTGERIGRNFANEFFYLFLRRMNKIPRDYEVFAHIWAGFDTKAALGNIDIVNFNQGNKEIVIEIKDSFLLRGSNGTHENCSFMEGYIYGILDEGFKELNRWLKATPYENPVESLAVADVEETERHNPLCKFLVALEIEQLSHAFDQYSTTKKLHYMEKKYDQASVHARITLEYAFKEKLDVPFNSHISFHQLVKSISTQNIQGIDFRGIRKMYGKISEAMHMGSEVSKKQSYAAIAKVGETIRELIKVILSEGQMMDAKKYIKKQPQTMDEYKRQYKQLEEEYSKAKTSFELETKKKEIEIAEEKLHLTKQIRIAKRTLNNIDDQLAIYPPGEKPINLLNKKQEMQSEFHRLEAKLNEIKKKLQ